MKISVSVSVLALVNSTEVSRAYSSWLPVELIKCMWEQVSAGNHICVAFVLIFSPEKVSAAPVSSLPSSVSLGVIVRLLISMDTHSGARLPMLPQL